MDTLFNEKTGDFRTLLEGQTTLLDVTRIPPPSKHQVIFEYFDGLEPGASIRILNDHDPRPLYYQLIAERGRNFQWTYFQSGPEVWEIEIRKNQAGITVGEIAAADIRKAEVFKKYGIDFCCGGKKTIAQVCTEKHIDKEALQEELDGCMKSEEDVIPLQFNRWRADSLADYIYNQHHVFYYETKEEIDELCEKVTAKHAIHFPQLAIVESLWKQLKADLETHFAREEKVLFPLIKALEKARFSKDSEVLGNLPSLKEAMQVMEADHEVAGELLGLIRKETGNFIPPANSCNTTRFYYLKLKDLDADLHQHVHLENNILFPKVLQLEEELRQSAAK